MAGKSFSIKAIFSALDRMSAPIAKIQTRLVQFGKGAGKALKGANSLVDKGLSAVGRASDALGIAGIASLAGLALGFRDVMDKGAEFEAMLIRAGTAFDVPVRIGTKGFAELAAAARKVGTTTEFSALQAAEAINSLATAGYDAQQTIAALPKVIDFASASAIELSQASDIASDTLGAFSLRSADATVNAANMGRVMDSLTRAAADSTTTVTELFEGIQAGGEFAASSGQSIEQFVALMGVLANKGSKGAVAGTAIRNAFLHLSAVTPDAAKTMKKLGVQIALTKAGAIDMPATIGRFTKATAKLTAVQRSAAIASVFGERAVGPFLALMGAGEKTVRKFTKNMEGAGGATERAAKAMRQSTAAKIKKFFGILNDIKLTVFDAIAPVVLDIADSISKWVVQNQALIGTKAGEWATTFRDALPSVWKWIKRCGVALAVFMVIAGTVKTITGLITIYGWLATACSGVATAYGWLTTSATTAAFRTTLLSAATKLSTAATWLGRAAQAAYTAVINTSAIAAVRLKVAEVASKIAQLASTAATWLANAAQTAYAIVLGTTSTGLVAFKAAAYATVPAITAQIAAFAPLMVALGAAALAVTALVLAWQQYNALDKDLAGSGGITGTVGKMWKMGTFDPFKAHDAVMNEKAIADRDKRDRAPPGAGAAQVISPQDRAAAATVEAGAAADASVNGTITVKAEPGTKASVKTKRNTLPIKLRPSGAFP